MDEDMDIDDSMDITILCTYCGTEIKNIVYKLESNDSINGIFCNKECVVLSLSNETTVTNRNFFIVDINKDLVSPTIITEYFTTFTTMMSACN